MIKTKLIKPSTTREIKMKCPGCGISHFERVPASAEKIKGRVLCGECGAEYKWKEE